MILNGLILIYVSGLIWYSIKMKFISAPSITHAGFGSLLLWFSPIIVELGLGSLTEEQADNGLIVFSEVAIYWISLVGGILGIVAMTIAFVVGYYRHKNTNYIQEDLFKSKLSDLLDQLPEGVEVDHKVTLPGSQNWKPLFSVTKIPDDCDKDQVHRVLNEVNQLILGTEMVDDVDDDGGNFVA